MDASEIGGYILIGLFVLAVGYYGYWFIFVHDHEYENIEATIVGKSVRSTGGGFLSGGGSQSICIAETDDGDRWNLKGTCYYIEGDRVILKFHDGKLEYDKLKVDKND